ncbi:MAG: hypothetical protein AAGC57_07250 [Pseudomonadota bacterium]
MPLQTRVTPFGEIVAEPWRGRLMGNRGILHDKAGQLGPARWRHRCWVCCLTEFRGRHRAIMPGPGAPTRYTALFFWDEACALAAGHRPCGECRHQDYQRFRRAWAAAGLPGEKAGEIDRVLHAGRIGPDRRQRRVPAWLADLPDGAMVLDPADSAACLLWHGDLLVWDPAGYRPRPGPLPKKVRLLTPEPTVAVLAAGFRPQIGPLAP